MHVVTLTWGATVQGNCHPIVGDVSGVDQHPTSTTTPLHDREEPTVGGL